MKSRGLKSFLE